MSEPERWRLAVRFPLDKSFKADHVVEKAVGRPRDDSGSDGITRDMGWESFSTELQARLAAARAADAVHGLKWKVRRRKG